MGKADDKHMGAARAVIANVHGEALVRFIAESLAMCTEDSEHVASLESEVARLRAELETERRMHADTNNSYIIMSEAHERARGFLRLAEEERDRLASALAAKEAELAVAKTALSKIDDIRNSIVGYQAINWSAHIYPLVAALEEAGVRGIGYEKAREMAITQLDRIAQLEAELARATSDEGVCESARVLVKKWKAMRVGHRLGMGAVAAFHECAEELERLVGGDK